MYVYIHIGDLDTGPVHQQGGPNRPHVDIPNHSLVRVYTDVKEFSCDAQSGSPVRCILDCRTKKLASSFFCILCAVFFFSPVIVQRSLVS